MTRNENLTASAQAEAISQGSEHNSNKESAAQTA